MNLTKTLNQTNFNTKPQISILNGDFNAVKQTIYQEYYLLLNARKQAFKDNVLISQNIEKICGWLQMVEKYPWCRIAGYIGNGKTTMLNALKNWFDKTHGRQRWIYYSAPDIIRNATADPDFIARIAKYHFLMIDDLGTEPQEIQIFGNKQQPIRDLFYLRYENRLTTLFTTNLTNEQFTEYYGARIADRCRELQLKIVFSQNSYRSNIN